MPKGRKKSPVSKPSPRLKIPPFDAIIFDIDNVLIDTRRSYLEAIRWTIDLYLTHGRVPFVQPNKKVKGPYLLSTHDVELFKLLGGFNDDWDCCYGILIYLLNLKTKVRTAEALKKEIKIASLVKKVKTRSLGVSGIIKMLGRPQGVRIEKIASIFQEIYLGKELFEKMEGRPALYWKKRGLISKEKMIVRQSTFRRLQEMGIALGIATGRPRFEALYALQAFGALGYFQAMTTIDEVKQAERKVKKSLRKPHPYSLIETAKRLGQHKRFVYVGDLPDDILAAKRAKQEIDICAVGFPNYAANPKSTAEQLKAVDPEFMLAKPGDLPRLVRSPASFVTTKS